MRGPDDRIRTCGILLPKQALYQTEPHPVMFNCFYKASALPVAVPDIFLDFQKSSSAIDRGHSLRSLDSATGSARFTPQPEPHPEAPKVLYMKAFKNAT